MKRRAHRLSEWVTRAGVRWDMPWLVEHPLVFRFYHRLARENAPGVVRSMRVLLPQARRWLDVGAGSGAFAAEARRQGIEVAVVEYSPWGRMAAWAQGIRAGRLDLARSRPTVVRGPLDLAYCLEVGQQLPPALGDRLVEFVAGVAPVVVFSSGQPGQGGVRPVNLRPRAYWIERFERNGMRAQSDLSARLAQAFRDEGVPGEWLAENVIVLERRHANGRGGETPRA